MAANKEKQEILDKLYDLYEDLALQIQKDILLFGTAFIKFDENGPKVIPFPELEKQIKTLPDDFFIEDWEKYRNPKK